jgi:hypothetical protein
MPPEVSLLDGVLERVTFANPDTGYTIARIDPDRGTRGGDSDLVTAVGPLLGAQVGESLRMRGRWTSHPKYGRQFEVHSVTGPRSSSCWPARAGPWPRPCAARAPAAGTPRSPTAWPAGDRQAI